MKLLIVRHGDPDYTIDSLTETGRIEARLLAERLGKLTIKDFYVSPLGRAKDTAEPTLKSMGRTAVECEWLREVAIKMQKSWSDRPRIIWDWLPNEWTSEKRFFDKNDWVKTPIMEELHVGEEMEWITSNFDALLIKHGYQRDGYQYRVVTPNEDTLVFFCHFGLECVLLGHLLHISPMVLWHGFCAAPTSVTTVVTEERREGIANFRMSSFGDISHLYAAGRESSFAARFCETFGRVDQRHD